MSIGLETARHAVAEAAEAGGVGDGEFFSEVVPSACTQGVEWQKVERSVRRNADVLDACYSRQEGEKITAQFLEELQVALLRFGATNGWVGRELQRRTIEGAPQLLRGGRQRCAAEWRTEGLDDLRIRALDKPDQPPLIDES